MYYRLDFSTSHHQVFICDKASTQDVGSESFWTEDATTARLAIGNGMLGVGLESYGRFKGDFFYWIPGIKTRTFSNLIMLWKGA